MLADCSWTGNKNCQIWFFFLKSHYVDGGDEHAFWQRENSCWWRWHQKGSSMPHISGLAGNATKLRKSLCYLHWRKTVALYAPTNNDHVTLNSPPNKPRPVHGQTNLWRKTTFLYSMPLGDIETNSGHGCCCACSCQQCLVMIVQVLEDHVDHHGCCCALSWETCNLDHCALNPLFHLPHVLRLLNGCLPALTPSTTPINYTNCNKS